MRTRTELVLLSVLLSLTACAGTNQRCPENAWFSLYDVGSSAPEAAAGGPVLAIWPDGVLAIAAHFPYHSSQLRVGRLSPRDRDTLKTSLQRLMLTLDLDVPVALGERLVRATLRPADNRPDVDVAERLVPICFTGSTCRGRLGDRSQALWDEASRILDGAEYGADVGTQSVRRARKFWAQDR